MVEVPVLGNDRALPAHRELVEFIIGVVVAGWKLCGVPGVVTETLQKTAARLTPQPGSSESYSAVSRIGNRRSVRRCDPLANYQRTIRRNTSATPSAKSGHETARQRPVFVRWSEEDEAYVGYCPDLFPAGGVCHGLSSLDAYAKLNEIVEDTVTTAQAQGLTLPPPRTRPMREVEMAA